MAIIGALAVVIADQTVKSIVTRQLGPASGGTGEYWIAGDWLGLNYGENPGIAFGLLQGQSTLVLLTGALLAVAFMAGVLLTRVVPVPVLVGGALIAGGAIGNLIDRLRFGHVRDFVAVGPWPLFNVADSAITAGVIVTFVFAFRDEKERARHDVHNREQGRSAEPAAGQSE
jgi:signal peptidase II